ncbi:hypothetical protein OG259_38270 [Streptomyces sp. NBC_00250]|uniref:hypothetical protein n=1 Tax=Streptomyces sp. NBC_00250 TaxID=2903641 RepID=UPI002E2BB298|nr:hypothetical protein [Streptomyces sp. NBC_00250]
MSTTRTPLDEVAPEARDRLLEHARPAAFPAGTRVFREPQHADRLLRAARRRCDTVAATRTNAEPPTCAR